ncbi:hypothetical protein NECAME_08734 [Necator americanus]|uniref:Uncharacterized protein n=1 Tax=Necator americanus TaxID=51031 RepID=W2TJ70_NECAM|nr:hypothetical protein NECAME_08734 [Necator americanus]ETN81072.1 hypothetical protein NECAME_08734 [Necator americanus]
MAGLKITFKKSEYQFNSVSSTLHRFRRARFQTPDLLLSLEKEPRANVILARSQCNTGFGNGQVMMGMRLGIVCPDLSLHLDFFVTCAVCTKTSPQNLQIIRKNCRKV